MDANRMPGDAEAAAAIAQMNGNGWFELPPIGSRVAYRTKAMTDVEFEAAQVVAHGSEDGRPTLVVELDGGAGLRVIDAREWPLGNILPF